MGIVGLAVLSERGVKSIVIVGLVSLAEITELAPLAGDSGLVSLAENN